MAMTNSCTSCGNKLCNIVNAVYSYAGSLKEGNRCCGCIPDGDRTRVCKPCYGVGYEFFGGK